MAGSIWQRRRGAHAVPIAARWRGAIPYLWVGLVGVVAQIVTVIAAPRALYFSDSVCYVDWNGCASHSPAVEWYWKIFTLGTMTEVAVMCLHVVLGVASALLLTGALIRLTPKWVAIVTGMIAAVYPMNLLLERLLMPETMQTFFLCLFFFAASRSLTARQANHQLSLAAVGFLSLGLLASVHVSVMFAVGALAATYLIALLVRLRRQAILRSAISLLGAAVLAGLLVAGPMVPVSARMHGYYGMWTPNPASSTYLAASWAPLLNCPPSGQLTPLAKAELDLFCKRDHFTKVPGRIQDMIFLWAYKDAKFAVSGTAPDGSAITKESFRLTQQQLRHAAIDGITSHPMAFVKEMSRSIWWQATDTLARPYPPYHQWRASTQNRPGWRTINSFLDGAKTGAPIDTDKGFIDFAENSAWIAQVLLWLAIAGGLARAVWGLVGRLRGRPSGSLRTPRVVLGVLAAEMTALSMFSVALAGHPSTRYWSAAVPALLILCALLWPPARSERQTIAVRTAD